MLRDQSVEEIYDGFFYTSDDPAPVGCGDCQGCSSCCQNTGDSIILDPYDMYMLSLGTGKTFEDMIEREIEIRLVDGLILPNLMKCPSDRNGQPDSVLAEKAEEPSENSYSEGERCPFLTPAGRCSIHAFRPGICRLYPLGRYYTDKGFAYILQKDECSGRQKTPVRVRDWLGIEDLPVYEAYILDWHDFRVRIREALPRLTQSSRQSVTRYILQIFFVHPYLMEMDFYPQYKARMEVCRDALKEILDNGAGVTL